jgi:fumarate hydratase subunit beta
MSIPSQEMGIIRIRTPVNEHAIDDLKVGDKIEIHGSILCGRDAVLPRLAALIERGALDSIGVSLNGAVIFHTAVSPAGIGPTTSNKVEIEGSIPALSKSPSRC